jgi:hypothetical protein
MADKKISALTALTAANVAPATDVVPIVDTSATETKKVTAKDLVDGALNGGTANGVLYLNGSKAATSGSALVFDGTNLGIGTSSPGGKLDVITGIARWRITNDGSGNVIQEALDSAGTAYSDHKLYGLNLISYTSGTERFRITSSGNVVAGGSIALATNATNGFLYVPTCAGTPTGTPTAITGMAPIVVNTTNNKLYFYSGGAWRDAGP